MKKALFLLWCVGCLPLFAGNYPSPDKWENEVRKFEAEDQAHPPPKGAILGIGSSSMRFWHGTIDRDLAHLTVLHRGFGGSNMNDVLTYMDRIVLPYQPRAILLYEGDNDIKQGVSAETFRDTFDAFRKAVHEKLPETRIYVIAIKPSPSRWSIWPEMNKGNELVKALCETDDRLHFFDIASPMMGEDGKPSPGYFIKDMLHMNETGYAVWTKVIAPVLLEREGKFEKSP